jgi:putative uncharacterized protein (fragment)
VTETSKETVLISDDIIKNKIYYIRNQRVMLDFELAEIYGYTTTRFNEQVKIIQRSLMMTLCFS